MGTAINSNPPVGDSRPPGIRKTRRGFSTAVACVDDLEVMTEPLQASIVHSFGQSVLPAILAGLWLKAVLQRLPSDREQWRDEPKMRPAIGIVWGISAIAVLYFVSLGFHAVLAIT